MRTVSIALIALAGFILLATGITSAATPNNNAQVDINVRGAPLSGYTTDAGFVVSFGAAPAMVFNGGNTAIPSGVIPLDGGYMPATRIPPTGSSLQSRSTLNIQNMGTSAIWCGSSATVNDQTGTQLDPIPSAGKAGGFMRVEAGSGVPIYCYSKTGQTSPADTRWVELQ